MKGESQEGGPHWSLSNPIFSRQVLSMLPGVRASERVRPIAVVPVAASDVTRLLI